MPDAQAVLDAIVERSRTPGLQYVAVNRDGTLFEYAGGWADLAKRRAMTAGTTLMAYSMSKTITAAAVLQLAGAGTIALDAPIDQYVTHPYGSGITVRQLLSHTSGIPNPIPLRWVHSMAAHEAFQEGAALTAVLERNPKLSFRPGTRFKYSNIGYWLLGRIVERGSGEPFTKYVHDRIAIPLGVNVDAFGYVVADPRHHAAGYLEKYSFINLIKGFVIDRALIGEYAGSWLEIRAHSPNGPAFGGIVGTAPAFATFLKDQVQPHSRLFDDRTRALFYEPQHTTSREIPMTLGWHMGANGGTRFFFKEGGGGGFHCMMRVYPERGLGTVVMTNATGFDVRVTLDDIDRRFF